MSEKKLITRLAEEILANNRNSISYRVALMMAVSKVKSLRPTSLGRLINQGPSWYVTHKKLRLLFEPSPEETITGKELLRGVAAIAIAEECNRLQSHPTPTT